MTIRALVEPPEPESTTLHAVTFTDTDAGSGVVVVRLVPEALIPAEEATLQVLGLVPTRSREVGHTTTRSVGFPAWVISTHPADTRQALRLVSDLEWARNTMPKVAKIEKKFATIIADLGDSAPYFVPTLMEELARIFAAGGKQAAAKRAFAKAREFERTYDLPVDSWRHRAAATEFAALGIIGAADMTREAQAASSRCTNPQEAYKYFLSLCINQIRAGGQVYAGMLCDIIRLGKAAGHSAADSGVHLLDGIAGSPALKTVPWQFYKELAEHIRPAATRKPELYARLFAHSTTQIDWYGSDPGEWFTMISDLGVVDIIASDQRVFVSWLASIIELEPYTPRRNGGDLTPIIRGIRDKADLVRGQQIPANIAKIPLEILATLTTAGATWDKKPDQQPMGESNQWRRVLQRLRHCHAGVLDLSALCADAELLAATLGDFSLADIPHHAVPTLVACGGTGLFDALTQAALDELARANHPLIGRTNFRKLVGGIPSQTLSPTTSISVRPPYWRPTSTLACSPNTPGRNWKTAGRASTSGPPSRCGNPIPASSSPPRTESPTSKTTPPYPNTITSTPTATPGRSPWAKTSSPSDTWPVPSDSTPNGPPGCRNRSTFTSGGTATTNSPPIRCPSPSVGSTAAE